MLCEGKRRDIVNGLDQCDAPFGDLADRADHFGMACMADEDDVLTLLDLAFRLAVHLAHQRAGCVDIQQFATVRFGRDRLGHAMSAENDGRIVRHFIELFDKDRPLGFQAVHHITVVDDFVTDIDRCPKLIERTLDNLDCAINAGAETARCGDEQLQRQATVVGAIRGLKGRVHAGPSSALLRAKLGHARLGQGREYEHTRNAADMTIRFRLLTALGMGLALAGCKTDGQLVVEGGGAGITAVRTACPAVGIPDYTGDVTLFRSPTSKTLADLDVTAAMTNLRSTCNDQGDRVYSEASFDVIARRTDVQGARSVQLPYFSTVLRGGTAVVTKRIGTVTLNFADGQDRATASAKAAAFVDRAEATLPADIREKITRKREAGDADAALDPLADPEVRAAVQRATFELLVGFQLTEDQLRYNATR